MEQGKRDQLSVVTERAVLAALLLPNDGLDPHDPLNELRQLASTAGAVVMDELMQKRQKPVASTFMGRGKVEELAEMVRVHDAQVVIFENDLSPSQIGNIEKIVERKVLDRSELILDIFAARARTHEAKLQVELAQLEYTYPRLRAMWTHLERIAGGAPAGIGTRGPGEQQLEIDRRIVQRKKSELRKEIVLVQGRKQREVAARNQDYFTVGLVGYTNAGKSTLFNILTTTQAGGGGAYADDKLFATLSTRTRRWDLGEGEGVMLSDTVGFVRNLPHHLVASFRATLEEAVHSDLLLMVVDVADERAQKEYQTVVEVLDDIGADAQPRVLVLNKIDRLDNNAELLLWQSEHPGSLAISAVTGQGLDALADVVREHAQGTPKDLTVTVHIGDGKAINFLETRATVLDRDYHDTTARLRVRIGSNQLERLRAMGTSMRVAGEKDRAAGGWGR